MNSKMGIFLSFLSATVLTVPPAEARTYTRSCSATVRITNALRNQVTVDVGRFSARATMDRYKPNSIRVEAHNRAVACVRAGWEHRNDDHGPNECTEDNGVHGYPEGVLAYLVGREACRAWGYEPGQSIHVRVHANVWGDKGCGGTRSSKSSPWVPISTLPGGEEITCR